MATQNNHSDAQAGGNQVMRPVEVAEFKGVPRWLVLQQEIDSRLFIIERLKDENAKRQPIERMIDESTGYDKQRLTDAQELVAELRWLKAEYDKETGADTEGIT